MNTETKSEPIKPLAGRVAADRTRERCNTFHLFKRFNRMPSKPMSYETLKQLGLV